MMENKKNFLGTFKQVIPFGLKPSIKNAKGEFWLMIFAGTIQSILLGLNIIIQAYFFQTVNNYANGGPATKVAIGLLILISSMIVQEISNALLNYVVDKFLDVGIRVITNDLIRKTKKLKPIFFENPENLLKLSRARAGASDLLVFLVFIILGVFGYLPFFAISIWYMASKNLSLALVFPILLLPAIIGYIANLKINIKKQKAETKISRVRDEYRKYIIGSAAKEMRTGGFYTFLYDRYKSGWSEVKSVRNKAQSKIFAVDLIVRTITSIAYAGVIYLIVRACLYGDAAAGFLAATISSVEFMFMIMEELMANVFAPFTERYGGINFYVDMMNEAEYVEGDDMTAIHNIDIRNLSFKYPNQEDYAVKGVDINLAKDKLVAVVGENGSGKSTLLKLVLGLFDDYEGSVEYFDKDHNKISNPNLRDKSSAIFQDFYKYKMLLKENVEISDLKNGGDYKDALTKAGLSHEMSIFPNGGETMLAREFSGVDLSGGQWQRVAIARGVYRDRDIIAFDEPTAAIDPLEESALYNKLREISQNKIGLLITHRIGSARIADEIIVMDKGSVIESGTHEALMEKRGKYFEMVNAQAEWYK